MPRTRAQSQGPMGPMPPIASLTLGSPMHTAPSSPSQGPPVSFAHPHPPPPTQGPQTSSQAHPPQQAPPSQQPPNPYDYLLRTLQQQIDGLTATVEMHASDAQAARETVVQLRQQNELLRAQLADRPATARPTASRVSAQSNSVPSLAPTMVPYGMFHDFKYKTGQPFATFERQFRAMTGTLSDANQLISLEGHVDATIQTMINNWRVIDPNVSFETVCERLRTAFPASLTNKATLSDLYTRRQQSGETTTQYAAAFRILATALLVPLDQVTDLWLEGLLSSDLHDKVLASRPTSFDDAIAMATRLEKRTEPTDSISDQFEKTIYGLTSRIKNLERSTNDRQQQRREPAKTDILRCHKCKQPGHKIFECPEVQCDECGMMGHLSGRCPRRTTGSTHQTRTASGNGVSRV